MSHLVEQERHTDHSSESEMDNYDSNDGASLNYDEEEEEEEGPDNSFGLSCNVSDNLVRGSIVFGLHINQIRSMRNNENEEGGGDASGESQSRIGPFSIPILQNGGNSGDRGQATSLTMTTGGGTEGGLSPLPSFIQAGHSTSTTTSLSDTASENMSTRAVMGDPPSTTGNSTGLPAIEDDADNSSQASLADSEADRVRRIHSSIFNSLENDLAELVRIREETIQFLENGTRTISNIRNGMEVTLPSSISPSAQGQENSGDGEPETERNQDNQDGSSNSNSNPLGSEGGTGAGAEAGDGPRLGTAESNSSEPFFLRERVTIHFRPLFSSFRPSYEGRFQRYSSTSNTISMNGRSYTPIANFDNAPPAKPAKPYVESGVTRCEEKAAAARKILDKLQYGDPEDENACFIRRFWRETSTQDMPPPTMQGPSPISLDIAAMAERTATLEATLEEAFDSLRLRLQRSAAENGNQNQNQNGESQNQENDGEDGRNETGGNEGGNNESQNRNQAQRVEPDSVPYYQAWDEETSIMNDPLNYDIWDELENGGDAGPTITARINIAERRANAVSRIRNHDRRTLENRNNSENQIRSGNFNSTAGVGVGTSIEGAELDDDSDDDDEEIPSYFRRRSNSIMNRTSNISNDDLDNLSEQGREFFREIGIPEELGRDLFSMFTFSEDEVSIPPNAGGGAGNSSMRNEEMPQPLFPRDEAPSTEVTGNGEENASTEIVPSTSPAARQEDINGNDDNNSNNEEYQNDGASMVPLIPMVSTEPGIRFLMNRDNDCSSRVYLDENNLNFPYQTNEDTEQD